MDTIDRKTAGFTSKKRHKTKEKSAETGKTISHCHPRLLEFIDEINQYVANNDDWMETDFEEDSKDKLEVILEEYGVTFWGAVILCFFIERYDDACITEGEIASHLHISRLSLVRHRKELDALREKRLIRRRNDRGGSCYNLFPAVMEALSKGEKYKPFAAQNLRPMRFFDLMDTLFEQRDNGELDYRDFIMEVRILIRRNKNIQFCKAIKDMSIDDNELIILLRLCHDAITCTDMPDIYGLYLSPFGRQYAENDASFQRIVRAINKGRHRLCSLNLIEKKPDEDDDPVEDETKFILSSTARECFLLDTNIFTKPEKNRNTEEDGVIFPDSIEAKKLFYNETEKIQIKRVESALAEDNYNAIRKRLKEKGMGAGIICLFSGEPGTGKTETALQLARKTGRNIIKIDLSEIKDSYVGNSEKNIKAVFDRYRKLLKKSKIAPILLFNEADGIFFKRIMINDDTINKTVAMSYNTIQNIILDEMERFEGILIATSNLICNMDSALERRFLYKVEFKKPGPQSQKAIWRSLIPELSVETADKLAGNFNLSGGQIQNIAKKSAINYIISGQPSDLACLESLSREEQPVKDTKNSIGFV